jgi:DNA-binding HxlR family transcriptional regulator
VRSYSQICGVAKGLDVIGDRWTLLIVRELLIRDACRYTDLRNGLPGIATNLLAQRLRELEQAGVIYSEAAPPPVATTLFHLTERGRALEPVLKAIGAWAGPLLARYGDEDSFQSHWLVLPLRFYGQDPTPDGPVAHIQLRPDGDEPILVKLGAGGIDARVGTTPNPELTLTGPARTVGRLTLGRINQDDAVREGVHADGNVQLLQRLRFRPPDQPN